MTLSAAAAFAVAHYALDEGSGNAVESVHGYTGVQNGTVGTGTVFSKAARDFTGSVTKYFETADNADLSGGDIDFCVIAQVRFHVVQGASLVSKEDSGNGEYRLYTDVSGNLFKFYCASAGGYGGIDIVVGHEPRGARDRHELPRRRLARRHEQPDRHLRQRQLGDAGLPRRRHLQQRDAVPDRPGRCC
jgi:hypothetical protein